MSRRSFLKTTSSWGVGLGIGATTFEKSYSSQESPVEPQPIKKLPTDKVVHTFCPMCGPNSNACGIKAIVRDGKFIGVEGLETSPVNIGKLCPKAHAAAQWVYSPDRITHPLRRVGEKGEGKFEKITWDQALDIIANKLKEQKAKYGPESLAVVTPAYRIYNGFIQRFLTAHGSPNYGHSGICAIQRSFAFQYTVGGNPRPDYDNTNLVILWGCQPVFAGTPKEGLRDLIEARDRGAKVITIKPTMEPDSLFGDIWVPVRPGTDAALALSFLNVIIKEKLYDKAFVEKWTYGFDRLVEHVKKYTPEWGEKVTGVPAKQIIDVAKLYATTKGASIAHGNGFEHAPSCNDAIRAVGIMMAITGNLDRPGGNLLGGRGRGGLKSVTFYDRVTQEMIDKLVDYEFPKALQPNAQGATASYYPIFESVLTEKPYPVRTIIAPGTQPPVSTRGTKTVLEALKKLDFYVVVDVTRAAGMEYADIVLPVTTIFEHNQHIQNTGNWLMGSNKVIEPLGNYKSDYEFWIELAVRLGYAKDFWNGKIEECLNDQLSPLGVTADELRSSPNGVFVPTKGSLTPTYENYEKVFSTPSTRLSKALYLPQRRVAIYNTTFEEIGLNPLPQWVEPPESITGTPELLEKFPLVFSDFHTSKHYTAGWQRNVPYLRELAPYPTVQIHPDTAKSRSIQNKDWVVVESPHGNIKMRAEINPGIRPDTAMALHGWWQGCKELGFEDFPLADGGSNTNNLYNTDRKKAFDPVVTAMSSQTLVQIRKA